MQMQQRLKRSNWAALAATQVSTFTIGLAASALIASAAVHAAATDAPSGSSVIQQTEIARAVGESISAGQTLDPGATITVAQLTHSEEMPNRRMTLARANELMQADNREVDAVAERLKEIIRARYEADQLNAESLATIKELRKKIAEYERLLSKSKLRQQLLTDDRDALEDQLNVVMGERDNALRDLTGERNDALAHGQQLQAELADKKGELDKLKDRLASVTADLSDTTAQLDQAIADKDRTENALAANQAILNERENKLARLNNQMTDKQDVLGLLERQLGDNSQRVNDLEAQVSQLTGDRDNTRNQLQAAEQQVAGMQDQADQQAKRLADLRNQLKRVTTERDGSQKKLADVKGQLDDKLRAIVGMEDRLTQLGADRNDALGRIKALEKQLASSENSANNLLSERDSLADSLNLFEQKAADFGNSFAEEQQKHIKTRANLAALNREADRLRAAIERLDGEKDALLNEAIDLKASRAELNGQLNATEKELAARQNELQAALTSIANLNGRIAELAKERDILASNVDKMGKRVVALRAGMDDSKLEFDNLIADANRQHAGEIKALEAEIASKKQNIALLNKDIAGLNADLADQQKQSDALVAGQEQQIGNLKARLAELSDAREKLLLANQQGAQQIDSLRNSVAELMEAQDNAEQQIAQLSDANKTLESQLNTANKQLASANNNFDRLKSDSEVQLAGLEKDIMDLTDTRASNTNQIARLESLNQQLGSELAATRNRLDMLTDQSTDKVKSLSDELAKLLSREKLYKANMLESGEKLQELANLNEALSGENQQLQSNNQNLISRNQVLTAELDTERQRLDRLQQDLGTANTELGGYQAELNIANQRLSELLEAQRMAEAERDRIAAEAEQLRVSLTDELDAARLENITVQKARADNSIPLRLGNADFFETGSARLTKAGGEKLTQLAKIIHSYHDRRIVVEGHTDDVPIGPTLLSRYASNWELSVARAAAAVRHMQRETDIDPVNLSAAGYGEYKPVGDNSTAEGRQQNRRVEVVLYPRESEFKNISDAEVSVPTMTAIEE